MAITEKSDINFLKAFPAFLKLDDADLDILVSVMDDPTMKLNATIMKACLAEQMLFVYEYIANKDAETKNEFNQSLNDFDAAAIIISTFYTGNATVINKINEI